MKITYLLVFVAISCLAGLAGIYIAGLHFWVGSAIGAGALLLNGIASEIEDRRGSKKRG